MEESISRTGSLCSALIEELVQEQGLTRDRLKTYSPLSFAYIGDAVYELMIRTLIVSQHNSRPRSYHKKTIDLVNAAAQTRLMKRICPLLTQEEQKIYRRGLNASPASAPRNQSKQDYRIATAFETLLGYLYLSGQSDRALFLVRTALDQEGKE